MIVAIIIAGLLALAFFSAKGQVEDNHAEVAAQAEREGKEPVGYVTGSSWGDTGCLLITTIVVGLGSALLIASALPAGILLPK